MKRNVVLVVSMVFAWFVGLAVNAIAASPLVDVNWLKANLNSQNTVFVDLRNKGAYAAGHVPGSVNSGYKADKWRMKRGEVKGMLPPVEHLEKLIGRLGIDHNTHVVLMHGGYSAAETGTATRVYWTFKVLGHENVSILNGGIKAYMSDKANKLSKVATKKTAKKFTAMLNKNVLATLGDVEEAVKNGGTFIDSRPTDQHMGINKSGAITRTGGLPGAISVPGRWLTINDKGTFRTMKSLGKLYSTQGVPNNKNHIVYCNTGHWASLGWFIDSELLGNKSSKMYDGSMAQWSRMPAKTHPMQVKVKID